MLLAECVKESHKEIEEDHREWHRENTSLVGREYLQEGHPVGRLAKGQLAECRLN
tara:strand:+ start:779 stop:943 length:165 start_codon:yes stop_codon:yes gene_type:complete